MGLIAYTSITRADTSGLALAKEHRATEEYIRKSGVPYVFLRNNWYLENYTEPRPVGAGVPEPFAAVLADSDLGTGRGELQESSVALATLIGRRPASVQEAVQTPCADR